MGPVTGDPSPGQTRILIADDDELIRTLAGAVLRKAGMHITQAADGGEALAHLESGESFSLAILDLDMPVLGGLALLEKIRGMSAPRLPVIVLTGSETEADRSAVIEVGADDYVSKPIVPANLVARVRAVLAKGADS